jgi:hypothetical protein
VILSFQDALKKFGGIEIMGNPGQTPEEVTSFAGGNDNPLAAQTIQSLTTLTTALKPRGYIADAMLPPLMVPKAQGYVWQAGDEYFKLPAANTANGYTWAPGTDFAEDGRDWSRTSYKCIPYALQSPVDRYTADQDDDPIRRAEGNAMWARHQMISLREYLVASVLNNTTTFASVTLTGEDQWFDGTDEGTTSDPNDDIWTACQTILDAGGTPTHVAMSLEVAKRLLDHSTMQAKWADTNQPGTPQLQWVLDSIMPADLSEQGVRLTGHIGSARYETAGEGVTSSRNYIWGNDVVVVGNIPSPGIDVSTVGFNMVQQGWSGKVEQFYSNERSANIIRVWECMVPKVLSTSCGYVIENVIT